MQATKVVNLDVGGTHQPVSRNNCRVDLPLSTLQTNAHSIAFFYVMGSHGMNPTSQTSKGPRPSRRPPPPSPVQLAFSSVSLALKFFSQDMAAGSWRQHHGTIAKRAGSGPNAAGSFELVDHFAVTTQPPAR